MGKLSAFLATPLPIPRLRAASHISCVAGYWRKPLSGTGRRLGEDSTDSPWDKSQLDRQHCPGCSKWRLRSGQGSLSDGHGPFCTFLCYHTLQIDNTYPRCLRARRYESSLKSGGESGWTAFKFVFTTTPLIRWSIYGTQITQQYKHISDICATPFLHSCHFQPTSINITQQKPRPQSADSPTSSKLNFAVISHISIWRTGTETLKEKFQQGESHVEILNDRWKLILRRVCSSVYVT